MDPRTKLGLVACAGILAITLERPMMLGLFAGCCAVPLLWVGVRAQWRRRGLITVAAIIWSTVLSQGLFYAEQPRVSLGPPAAGPGRPRPILRLLLQGPQGSLARRALPLDSAGLCACPGHARAIARSLPEACRIGAADCRSSSSSRHTG